MTDLTSLPSDLPVPIDDGAADHLVGLSVVGLELNGTHGVMSLVAETPWTVLYVYPRTGGPAVALPDGWDRIPGARGCTPQSCAFRDHHQELASLGASVRGISAQPLSEQQEFAERMHIPFPLLNDEALTLAHEPLELPNYPELRLYKRLTVAIFAGAIQKAWYPVFPPDRNADDVVSYLTETGARSG